MIKLLTITSLTFYFFALLFGLILFSGQLVPKAALIALQNAYAGNEADTENQLEACKKEELDALDREISAKREELQKSQEEIAKTNTQIRTSRAQIRRLTMEQQSLEQGKSLARLYSSMEPDDVAELIAQVAQSNKEMIRLIVTYAFPYMKERVLGQTMNSLTKKYPDIGATIVEMMAQNDDKQVAKKN